MRTNELPLEELSIEALYNGERAIYEVPIYQRNYAWEEDEIRALVQDVYDAFCSKKQNYYIGTLVTYDKGENVYEVIDGQQRLTTIFLVLSALGVTCTNRLTYRARQQSKKTIENIRTLDKIDEKDEAIYQGFGYAERAKEDIVDAADMEKFKDYFLNSVHIIRYTVPKDVDLNHYFEVMNSRGEQLEKHEIVKAKLSGILRSESESDFTKFAQIWDACSDMSAYVQQKLPDPAIFGANLNSFIAADFQSIPHKDNPQGDISIEDMLGQPTVAEINESAGIDRNDAFQPIIDFPNFLLIVLKITLWMEHKLNPASFSLDDKELIKEFDKVETTADFARTFAFNLLKAKYLLDNFVVHHINGDDKTGDNPWKLQQYTKEGNSGHPRNLSEDSATQDELVQLLSMFEVSFSPRQRKNYLFYCLLHLFGGSELEEYLQFLQNLASKYFYDVYLDQENLTEKNNPKPNSFDTAILGDDSLNVIPSNLKRDFNEVYGDGTQACKGIQLFVFNYTDYKLWKLYADLLRGKRLKVKNEDRASFFINRLGCSDFGIKVFDDFYFSRTRKSLEHFYPRNKAEKYQSLSGEQINCFGNYAMIGAAANSSGSDWAPIEKLHRYTDKKTDQIGAASLKLKVMMQMCADNSSKRESGDEWNFDDIRLHQEKMVDILMDNGKQP